MTLKSEEAYLHKVTGGFDNDKRREVRTLFASQSDEDEDEEETDMDNMDIAVGIIEEFYFINVQTFTLDQATSVVAIFKLESLFPQPIELPTPKSIAETLRTYFNSPRAQLASPKDDTWTVPNEVNLERLKIQFCKRDADEIKAKIKGK